MMKALRVRTSLPSVDVTEGRPELTPVAIQAGRLLARRLFAGQTIKVSVTTLDSVLYCISFQ